MLYVCLYVYVSVFVYIVYKIRKTVNRPVINNNGRETERTVYIDDPDSAH